MKRCIFGTTLAGGYAICKTCGRLCTSCGKTSTTRRHLFRCKNATLEKSCTPSAAEQAFIAVQMLVIELDNPYLEGQLDRIADTLKNDERYRPSQFAAMLAALAEPEPEAEDIDEQDE